MATLDPEQFTRQVDPAALAEAVAAIVLWRDEHKAYFDALPGIDPRMREGSLLGIELQAHMRALIVSFTMSCPPSMGGIAGNAVLTALSHCAALILAEGEASGIPRAIGLSHMINRINTVIDEELERDRAGF